MTLSKLLTDLWLLQVNLLTGQLLSDARRHATPKAILRRGGSLPQSCRLNGGNPRTGEAQERTVLTSSDRRPQLEAAVQTRQLCSGEAPHCTEARRGNLPPPDFLKIALEIIRITALITVRD